MKDQCNKIHNFESATKCLETKHRGCAFKHVHGRSHDLVTDDLVSKFESATECMETQHRYGTFKNAHSRSHDLVKNDLVL